MKKFYKNSLVLAALLTSAFGVHAAEHRTIVGSQPEDRSGWVVTGCSQQDVDAAVGSDGGLNHIIDDNVNTFWHTSWAGVVDQESYPHYIIFDRGEDAPEVAAFSYTPRQSAGGNGFVTDFRLFAVDEAPAEIPVCEGSRSCADPTHAAGIAWANSHTPAAQGKFDIIYNVESTHGEHLVVLDEPTSARYLVFVIDNCSNSANGKFANCAEFRTYGAVEESVWYDPADTLFGKHVKFKNAMHPHYMGIYNGEALGFANGADCVWSVIDCENGKVKLFNEYTQKYVGHMAEANNVRISVVESAEEAGEWIISWLDNAVRDQIVITYEGAEIPAMHMVNWDGVVRWYTNAEASHFTAEIVTDEDFEEFAAAHINQYSFGGIGMRPMTEDIAKAIEDVKNNPSDFSFYRALTAAAEANQEPFVLPEAGKYYTITSLQANADGKKIVEPYGTDVVKLKNENGVPALWQFAACDEPDNDLFYITAPNTGLYLSRVSFGKATTMVEAPSADEGDEADAQEEGEQPAPVGKYDITNPQHSGNGGISLVCYNDDARADYSVARVKEDGTFDSYKEGILPWSIEEVTAMPVEIVDGFGSFHFPFAVSVPEGVKVYTVGSVADYKATLEEVALTEVPANTPVIVYAETEAEFIDFPILAASEVDTQADGLLKGLNVPEKIENAYVLSGNVFLPVDETEGVPANSAYIIGDGESDVVISIPASNILLNKTEATLEIGETVTLEATVAPSNATESKISWKSSDVTVATVSAEGVVTAIAQGTATITATCGAVKAECVVTVNAPAPIVAESVTLSKTSLTLEEGETETLTATVLPEDAADKTIVWTSSNALVASVSDQGVVTAVSAGTATITATCGSVKAECTVVVTSPEDVSIEAIRANAAAYEIYDINGRRISALPAKGVYLINLGSRIVKVTL